MEGLSWYSWSTSLGLSLQAVTVKGVNQWIIIDDQKYFSLISTGAAYRDCWLLFLAVSDSDRRFAAARVALASGTSSVKKPSAPAAMHVAISAGLLSVQYTTRLPAACARATNSLGHSIDDNIQKVSIRKNNFALDFSLNLKNNAWEIFLSRGQEGGGSCLDAVRRMKGAMWPISGHSWAMAWYDGRESRSGCPRISVY